MAVADLALTSAAIADPRIAAAQEALAIGLCGDSKARSELAELIQELDEKAWKIQEQVDRGRRAYDDYSMAFRRARATAALWSALEADPCVAALEATYEAQAAAEDMTPIAEAAREILEGDEGPAPTPSGTT